MITIGDTINVTWLNGRYISHLTLQRKEEGLWWLKTTTGIIIAINPLSSEIQFIALEKGRANEH